MKTGLSQGTRGSGLPPSFQKERKENFYLFSTLASYSSIKVLSVCLTIVVVDPMDQFITSSELHLIHCRPEGEDETDV